MPAEQIHLISREEWGARDPKEGIPTFEYPGKTVILTLKTDFGECHTKEECIKRCQSIQNQHMDEWGLPDISYNFMIGEDGNVYEGRGWGFRPQKAIHNPDHGPQTFDIGLLGDYRGRVPNSIHYTIFSWQDHSEQFKLLGPAYAVYPWVDSKDTYDQDIIDREHEEFKKKYPDLVKFYEKGPDIRFDDFELIKQTEGKKVKDKFPCLPVV